MALQKIIYCEQCGKPFERTANNQKICSDECKRVRYSIFGKTHLYEKTKAENKKISKSVSSIELRKKVTKKKSIESMAEINRKAREMGLTYGQYMALQTADMLRHDRRTE